MLATPCFLFSLKLTNLLDTSGANVSPLLCDQVLIDLLKGKGQRSLEILA